MHARVAHIKEYHWHHIKQASGPSKLTSGIRLDPESQISDRERH